jgi:hypothetical protein
VEVLLAEVSALSQQQQQQQPELLPALQALLFTCCGNGDNVQRLLHAGGSLATLTALSQGEVCSCMAACAQRPQPPRRAPTPYV